MDLGNIFHDSCAGNPTVWVEDVGDEPPHGANLGGVPPLRVPEHHRESPTMPHRRVLVYPPLDDALREAGLEKMVV